MESPDNQNNMNQVCTESRCTDGDAEKKIVCRKCKRAVHFVRTKLPTYQLKLFYTKNYRCLLYTSPSPRDKRQSRMPSSA